MVLVIFVLLQLLLSCYSDLLCLLFNKKKCILVFYMSQCYFFFSRSTEKSGLAVRSDGLHQKCSVQVNTCTKWWSERGNAVKITCSKKRRRFWYISHFSLVINNYSPCFYILEDCDLTSTEKIFTIFVNECVFKTLYFKITFTFKLW